MSVRSYDDPCGIARALDAVGERWALLVVRELMFGPKRFTDLRAGLPGASQNVLSHRLRELAESGLVSRRRLGPPAGAWAYELTGRGHALRPVVIELARWGSQLPIASATDLSVAALMVALLTTFSPSRAGELRAAYQLRLAGEDFHASVAGGQIDIARGIVDRPDAMIETDARTFRDVVFGGRGIDDAIAAGDATVAGDGRSAARFLGLFPRPAVTAGG